MVAGSAIRRGFVDLDEGQLHYRYLAGPPRTPLVLLHQASGSSRMMVPLMPALAAGRPIIAFDLPGNGDSCAPKAAEPGIADYADAIGRALDALGLKAFAVYGFHAGASVALELALARPEQARAIILDSLGLYEPEAARRLAQDYAPAFERHPHGLHLQAVWHYVRDTYLFWPWYATDAEHRRPIGLPPVGELHDKVVEVLKGMDHFAKLYRAAFLHDKRPRLPLLRLPALIAVGAANSQRGSAEAVAALVPGAELTVTEGVYDPAAAGRTADGYAAWLATALKEA